MESNKQDRHIKKEKHDYTAVIQTPLSEFVETAQTPKHSTGFSNKALKLTTCAWPFNFLPVHAIFSGLSMMVTTMTMTTMKMMKMMMMRRRTATAATTTTTMMMMMGLWLWL